MEVFSHHLYEYRKGLRRLVLHTTGVEHRAIISSRLENRNISFIIKEISSSKINVFFGSSCCIDVLNTFPHLNLNSFTPEQDFLLGAMLGYDMKAQCKRYINFIERQARKEDSRELKAAI